MSKTKTKILIEVAGGCIVNFKSTDEIELYVSDYDNLEQFDDPNIVDQIRIPYHPEVVSEDEIKKIIENLEI